MGRQVDAVLRSDLGPQHARLPHQKGSERVSVVNRGQLSRKLSSSQPICICRNVLMYSLQQPVLNSKNTYYHNNDKAIRTCPWPASCLRRRGGACSCWHSSS